MFRENMHPSRANARPINIEVECSCELSHANVSSMKKEKSEKSKKSNVRVRTRHMVIDGPAPYPLTYRDSVCSGGRKTGGSNE